ncbi:hypothetical protein T484DRAFT_1983581 [Baffinella frigidus]|nr:hypothetical protein T484DRAFT_1983581 [Cryptophyta sp. CCMP2293]
MLGEVICIRMPDGCGCCGETTRMPCDCCGGGETCMPDSGGETTMYRPCCCCGDTTSIPGGNLCGECTMRC